MRTAVTMFIAWSLLCGLALRAGERMSNISALCHEFGHFLGLPDLYARPENPGSEGAGVPDSSGCISFLGESVARGNILRVIIWV